MKLLGSHASPYAHKVPVLAADPGDREWPVAARLDLAALMHRLEPRPSFATTGRAA